MILLFVAATWAAERAPETRFSLLAMAHTEYRTLLGAAGEIDLTHQFKLPIAIGLGFVVGTERYPAYSYPPEYADLFPAPSAHTWADFWPHIGYTVQSGKLDVTPTLRWSTDDTYDAIDTGIPALSGDVRWWWTDHWSLLAQVGPLKLEDTGSGFLDLGLGVAWRARAPHDGG